MNNTAEKLGYMKNDATITVHDAQMMFQNCLVAYVESSAGGVPKSFSDTKVLNEYTTRFVQWLQEQEPFVHRCYTSLVVECGWQTGDTISLETRAFASVSALPFLNGGKYLVGVKEATSQKV